MARVFLLIDGYNLLHAAGLGRRRFAKGGLELARRKLLLKLAAEMASDVCRDTVVVFDAGPDAESRQNSETAAPAGEVDWPFAVVYATQTQSADDEIERLLGTHSSPRQILVISSDHRLHKAAARRGAQGLDSDQFLTLLESGKVTQSGLRIRKKPQNRQKSSSPGNATPDSPKTARRPPNEHRDEKGEIAELNEELLGLDLDYLLRLDLPAWNPPRKKNSHPKRP